MRDFKNMKRQRGRNRGGGGGGGKPQQNANRAFDSNGPDNVKIRGHAQHVFEKYQQLARDAFSSGDRVLAENYLQHADHYFRVLRTIQPQRPPSEILGRDVLASGLDIDFEEEFEPTEEVAEAAAPEGGSDMNAGEQPRDGQRAEGQRFDGQRSEGQRSDGQRFEGRREDRWERDGRRDGYRDDREPRGDREARRDGEGYRSEGRDRYEARDRNEPRDRSENRDRTDGRERSEGRSEGRYEGRDRYDNRDRQDGRDRGEGRRDRERRFEGRRDERSFNRDREPARESHYSDRPAAEAEVVSDPLAVTAPEAAAPFPTASSGEAEGSPVLRSEDGGMSEAPAFLQAAPSEEERKPRARRRRAPKSFEAPEGGEAPAALAPEDA